MNDRAHATDTTGEHGTQVLPGAAHLAPAHRAPLDLLGYTVQASDGPAGTVDGHTEEVGPHHLVVDTGGALLSKKVLLPRWAVAHVDEDERTLQVTCGRDSVKAAPRFDPDMRVTDPGYRTRIDEHYRAQPQL
ncbi:PRC-barrel domain-containing protein [Streptomyces sp. NPDC006552]|uniref:PRC-barrel domain-containing protein n=1 Tax=Streptomyces sp. NPDC006552 TaxID=3157179 RepID=UPI0033A8F511